MLAVEQLTFGYPGRTLIDWISFQLKPAAITCLLGGSGAGKTTLFNLVTGFLRPTSGAVHFGNHKLTGQAPYRIARLGLARTFQDLRLIGKLSVRENLLLALPRHPGERLASALLPPRLHHRHDESDRHRSDELLAAFFLDAVIEQPAEISYGQQKLLTPACCAALDAKVLLLDEPLAGISPECRERIAERLAAFKAGKTILLIEHQADFLQHTGDAFLLLDGGRLHSYATLAELRGAPTVDHALA
jgi:branched-chain amino acid transport system ATP-binding protein